ncbi:uncharacterized protein LOC129761056 [Uranotaenia lowii]|uniref:uncharacterized protein LOC129761056 n=1 Tax=Uranotaenia lowii TaxID=190385 RepID=UPI0024796D11|nr:uncharacterized protein LOC129761056 [Uranotaenia lowii]
MADPEQLQALTRMLADALKSSLRSLGPLNAAPPAAEAAAKPPSFSVSEYRSSEDSTVADYFKRFEWALELSKIPEEQYAHYARVYMGAELNNAIKFLVSPQDPAELPFVDIRNKLVEHFDHPKDNFRLIFVLGQTSVLCAETFNAAFEVAHTLEATRNSANEVQTAKPSVYGESTNKLGFEKPKTRKGKSIKLSSHKHQRTEPKESAEGNVKKCNGCGGQHKRSECKYRDAECFTCKGKGHISTVCRSGKQKSQHRSTYQVQAHQQPAALVDEVQSLSKIHSFAASKQVINVNIDGYEIPMEVDTGAPCGIISENKFRSIKPKCVLLKSDRQFSSYTGHPIVCLGSLPVNVRIGKTTQSGFPNLQRK